MKINESIKNVDPTNIVPQELAEKLGFKPEYKSYEDGIGYGLELWGKRLDFDPYDEYSGKTKKLLGELGIKEFTSWSRSMAGNSGYVRITVKPKPKSDAQYASPKPIEPEPYVESDDNKEKENKNRKHTIKVNESTLKRIIAESVKKVLKENRDCDDFCKYVMDKFREEGIEIGDAGDAEELYQGCANYDYETVPFEELYQKVKKDWLSYKKEQGGYQGINEAKLKKKTRI